MQKQTLIHNVLVYKYWNILQTVSTCLIMFSFLLQSCTNNDKEQKVEVKQPAMIEGTYMQKDELYLLHFNRDGFVYVEFTGIDSDYWSDITKDEGKEVSVRMLMSLKESFSMRKDNIPVPNFYKYTKEGSTIYIDLLDKGYMGLDCSNTNQLKELAKGTSVWTKK